VRWFRSSPAPSTRTLTDSAVGRRKKERRSETSAALVSRPKTIARLRWPLSAVISEPSVILVRHQRYRPIVVSSPFIAFSLSPRRICRNSSRAPIGQRGSERVWTEPGRDDIIIIQTRLLFSTHIVRPTILCVGDYRRR